MIRTLRAATAACLAAGVVAAGTAGASASTESGTIARTGVAAVTTDEAGLTGQLRSLSPAVLSGSGTIAASVTARNTGGEPLEGVQVVLSLTDAPLESTDDLAAFLDDPSDASTTEVARAPEPDPDADTADETTEESTAEVAEEEVLPGITLEPNAAASMSVEADAADLGLPEDEWGVYGIEIALESADGSVHVGAGAVTWADAEVPGIDVAVLALAEGTELDVASTLEDTALDGVAVAVDPTVLTNAMVLDHGLLEREVLRLPAGSPDLTSLAHGGGDELYDFAVTRPSASTVLATASMPLLAPLPVADDASVALAERSGALATLVMPGTVGADALEGTVNVTGDSDLPIVAPDRVLTEIIAAASADPAVEGALLAASALSDDQVLVSVGGDGAVTERKSHLIETLLNAPWVTPVSMAALAASTDITEASLPAVAGDDADLAADDVERLMGRYDNLTTLSTIVDKPADAMDEWAAGLVAGVTTQGRTASALREGAFTTALAGADATLGAVTIAEGSDLNLLADSGDVPITVMNGLDRDVTVVVEMDSNSPNLIVEDSPTVTVGAGLEATALVPVSAVSTANVTVVVGLESADGDAISPLQTFDIRVRADWGTAGAAIFTALLVLLLIAGVIRTIRRGRKDTRLAPSQATIDPTADPGHEEDDSAEDEASPRGPAKDGKDG